MKKSPEDFNMNSRERSSRKKDNVPKQPWKGLNKLYSDNPVQSRRS